MTFRRRIILGHGAVLCPVGGLRRNGAVLIYHLGGHGATILRENYDSVAAMRELNEALEGIIASFSLALAGREEDADRRNPRQWNLYRKA